MFLRTKKANVLEYRCMYGNSIQFSGIQHVHLSLEYGHRQFMVLYICCTMVTLM